MILVVASCYGAHRAHDVPGDGRTSIDGLQPTGDGQMPTSSDDGSAACPSGFKMFPYTGSPEAYMPPSCVTSINVDLSGAAGGTAYYYNARSSPGGYGARVQGTLAIAPGSTINVYVGGVGGDSTAFTAGTRGFNGGGSGAGTTNPNGTGGSTGGGGGGASDIRIGGSDLAHRVFIAAGGGGGGSCSNNLASGGNGGITFGDPPVTCDGKATLPTGGTQTTGGLAGTYPSGGCISSGHSGMLGVGGDSGPTDCGGGGGGGGYYGGGGGNTTGGAGGSSHAGSAATDVIETAGSNAGPGVVWIYY
jgi:hypothetical protein